MTPPPAGSHAAHAYLDHAATTPVRPEVLAAMAEAMAEAGNASSVHGPGRLARSRLEAARRAVAERVAVAADRVVFTSGGTEANHLALLGLIGPRLVSAIEHASVLEAVPEATRVPVDAAGRLDLAALAGLLRGHRPAVVSVMLANNETGVIQPVAEAARLAHAHGSLLHCDAVQAFTKLPFTLAGLGADLLTVSAHKIGGPPGIGALVLRDGLEVVPLQRGGGQELRRRAGTENLPGIVGFSRALGLATDWERVRRLRDRTEAAARALHPAAIVVGGGADRLPNVVCLLTPGLSAEVQLMALDLAGVAVSSGAACSSGKVGPSHVLAAMGFTPELARCTIRVSLGWSSTAADVKRFADAWGTLLARRSGRAASPVPA
ncbi:MAG TPA: cysteine desulfurase family protein [Geminicoccaceae bacterium]|nr:cysteine desulfurase family protein [Geminicoccaceae bacterium]